MLQGRNTIATKHLRIETRVIMLPDMLLNTFRGFVYKIIILFFLRKESKWNQNSYASFKIRRVIRQIVFIEFCLDIYVICIINT